MASGVRAALSAREVVGFLAGDFSAIGLRGGKLRGSATGSLAALLGFEIGSEVCCVTALVTEFEFFFDSVLVGVVGGIAGSVEVVETAAGGDGMPRSIEELEGDAVGTLPV